jgi:MshEN domain
VSFELGRALLLTETLTAEALADAFLTSAREGVSLVRALLMTRAIESWRLEQELSRLETPSVRAVVPARDLMEQLPGGLCVRLLAVPVRRDPQMGTVDVVVADLRDAQGAFEIGFHLGAPVRAIRAPLSAIERALAGQPPPLPRPRPPAPSTPAPKTPPWGTAARAGPPTQDIPIPLLSRKPPADGNATAARNAPRNTPPLLLRTPPTAVDAKSLARRHSAPTPVTPDLGTAARAATDLRPAADLVSAVESAVEQVAQSRDSNTLLPPPNLSVPPPPNTQRLPSPADEAPTTTPEKRESEATLRVSFPSFPPEEPGTVPGVVLPDAGSVLAAIRTAKTRDAVLQLLLLGTRSVARRVALFIVRREAFVGWSCTPEFGESAELRAILIPAEAPSVLATAATNGSYLGAIPATPAHELIREIMRTSTRDVAIWPVRVFGRPTVMIVADELGDVMIATRRMEELARTGGEALARIVRERADLR